MTNSLNREDIEFLLGSLRYSKDRIASALGTPQSVRSEELDRLGQIESKLRTIRDDMKLSSGEK